MRKAGSLFTKTFGEPVIAGPLTGCGHKGHQWTSMGLNEMSNNRPCGGMRPLYCTCGPYPTYRYTGMANNLRPASSMVSCLLQKQNRTRLLPSRGSAKKLDPGTAATPACSII